MTAKLVHIWRHPIKGIGCEALVSARLTAGAPLAKDRAWAVLHDNAAADTTDWQPRRNFLVVASGPQLAPIAAEFISDTAIRLTHPARPALDFDPNSEGGRLIDWIRPLWPEERPAPLRLVPAPSCGMADNGLAQLSVLNLSSLRALSQKIGQPLDPRRFRGNLWLDGLAPWEEFDLIGKTIRIGAVALRITDRIERCRATEANPETGRRDVDPPRALSTGWGHRDFGVYADVLNDGDVTLNQAVTLQ